MAATAHILFPVDQIAAFCRKWKIAELSLFGSVLRQDFGPHSAVDVLVPFAKDAAWSLWDWTAMIDELQSLLDRPVDLTDREALRNPFRRHEILRTRKVIYAA